MAVFLLACGTETLEQEDEIGTAHIAPPPYTPGVVLIEREIIFRDAIIRGALNSVEASAISDAEGKYRPSVKFNFAVLEALKGIYAGGTISGIWIGEYGYDTRDEAIALSRQHIAERDTQWDSREAILFLYKRQYPDLDEGALGTPSLHILARVYEYVGPSDDHYSLYSAYHRSWLPLANTAGQGNDKEYLLAPPAPTDALDHPNGSTITLGGMKQLIADITAQYDGGDGSQAYQDCLDSKYRYLEDVRNWPIARGFPYTRWEADPTIESGQPANTIIDSVTFPLGVGSGYQVGDTIPVSPVISFVGADADLFAKSTTLVRSGPEYDDLLQAVRPLPAGIYEFTMETRPVAYVICNHFYRDEYTVTVTASEGVLHELFLDPVAVGTAVKAGGTNGVLEPASFSDANGASATLQSISYEPPSSGSGDGTVKVQVDPHTGLGGHRLDFIELDGSVSLSLDVGAATVDAPSNTLSWSVSSQPWDDGDELMLRIAEVVPEVVLVDVPSTISVGQGETFTVRASGLTATELYRIRLSVNGTLGIVSCSRASNTVTVPSGSTSHSMDEEVHGCRAGTGRVTATLLEGSEGQETAIANVTSRVEVESESSVTVTLSRRETLYDTWTDMTVEWTDVGECEGRYLVGVLDRSKTMVRNLGFHPAPATTSLEADPSVYWDDIPSLDWTVRVTCAPTAGSWTVVGEASLQSGLPSD